MAGTSIETHTHSHSHWNSHSSADQSLNFKNLHTREYSSHKKKVHSVAWNCTGTKLASGSVDQTARIWNIEPHGHAKGKDLELKGHSDSVDQLCWDPKHADLLATASGDKTVRLWDARSGKCSQQVELSGENINITFKPDGTHIAVGNRDDELTFIDVRKFKPIHKRKFGYELVFGPRGTGKSTTARIFAVALNCSCVDGDRKPCWQCKNCLLLKAKKCPNICEISSYDVGGLDHLKSLIRNPDLSSYEVFIVEYFHESRSEDLNLMLLECIENQHGNAVVILTTIDMELLPKYVLSRCQKFRFQKIKEPEMYSKLKSMACLENMDIEEAALRLIASRADGSLAEAENQLEQCSLISSKITVSTLSQMIGVIPSQKLVDLLFFAIAANTEKTIQLATEISDSGIKPLALVSQLAALITDILANDFSLADKRTVHNFLSHCQSNIQLNEGDAA